MKRIIKFLFTLLILFAFSCTQETTLDPIEQELSPDQKEDAIDLSAFEVKDNLTLAEFEAAENGLDSRHRYYRTKAPVIDVVNGGEEVGKATLLRGRNGVFVYARTSNLIPGHVYTLWWVIWNNPENCEKPYACTDTDFGNAENVKVEVMYASGRIAGRNGKASFLAYLRENDASGTTNPIFGLPSYGGLLDSKNAEVHIVVRSHGPAIPWQIWDQLTSYEGGCDDPLAFPPFSEIPDEAGECGDIHAAVFAPREVLIKDHNSNVIQGASSTLYRNKNRITVNFKTDGLIPGNAYTLWFVVFGDAPGPPSSTHAAGLIVDRSGKGNFSGHISVGDIFDNPLTAEVHMALRTHGPAQPGMIPDQLQTIDGGCNLDIGFPSGPSLHADSDMVGYCANIQVAMHPSIN